MVGGSTAVPQGGRQQLRLFVGGTAGSVTLDVDLRWRILVRLATIGAVDLAELDRQLAAEPGAVAKIQHAGARASLPEADAKAWAWGCFTGETDLPNYELEAVGLGFWRGGQEELTDPYVILGLSY